VFSNRHSEDLPKIGSGVCADQQDLSPFIRQGDCGGTSQRGFANSTFAREEQKSCGLFQKSHGITLDLSLFATAGCSTSWFVATAATTRNHREFINADARPIRQLLTLGEDAPADYGIVHNNDRQAIATVLLQLLSNKLAACEQGRLMCGVDPLNLYAMTLQPLKIG